MGTLALILSGAIVNVIAVALTSSNDPETGASLIGLDNPAALNASYGTGGGFDCAPIRIDTLTPSPGIGWTYATGIFTSPDQSQTVTVG